MNNQNNNHDSSTTLVKVGWREWASLPDLGIDRIEAKVDTGARTSALHATDIHLFEKNNETWVKFNAVIERGDDENDSVAVECPLVEKREVRSSNGDTEIRPTISTTLAIGGLCYKIIITLTNRGDMRFRMLLGREALKKRFLVDSSTSHNLQPLK